MGAPKSILIEFLIIIELMDGITYRIAHTEHPNIGQKDVTIFDLVLGMVRCNIHAIAPFYKIALSKDSANHGQANSRNNMSLRVILITPMIQSIGESFVREDGVAAKLYS